MPHRKCAYVNCANNKPHNQNLAFFKFPVSDKKRCREWIKNSGNQSLLDNEYLENKTLCEVHFDSTCMRDTGKRKMLYRDAVPVPFNLIKGKIDNTDIAIAGSSTNVGCNIEK